MLKSERMIVYMPTYEYQCEECGYVFEKFQNINAESIKICPECKGRVRRLISGGSGIILKGSGSYQTETSACCGITNPCDNPKRCCGR